MSPWIHVQNSLRESCFVLRQRQPVQLSQQLRRTQLSLPTSARVGSRRDDWRHRARLASHLPNKRCLADPGLRRPRSDVRLVSTSARENTHAGHAV
jgi:hypothetical protein